MSLERARMLKQQYISNLVEKLRAAKSNPGGKKPVTETRTVDRDSQKFLETANSVVRANQSGTYLTGNAATGYKMMDETQIEMENTFN